MNFAQTSKKSVLIGKLSGLALTAVLVMAHPGLAGGPRVLPKGQLPADKRLGPLKDLDGYFPFQPPATREVWEKRTAEVRRRVQVANGLWPMPERTPLNPVIHGRVDRGEYTIDKVFFESRPGFFVTGNLYRPANVKKPAPGILFAHGHWTDARLADASPAELKGEIATGQERFEQGGRSRFQSMCVQLARMGCVVFQYDMLGNSDSQQIPMAVAHTFGKQRASMNASTNWGLYSPAAEGHLQSIMGLQTWNSIRSLDFLLTLQEVDPKRIACTGASGGGTQTFLLGALDPRVALSFPAVMVSTAMQGGCTCENSSLLRIGTGNVELAALFAPKPQGMTTANDWTREMSTKGFPELQQHYRMMGAPDKVMLHRGEHFPHNYNAVSRTAFYNWLNRHFQLGFEEPILEKDYVVSTRAEMSVWDDAHPHPPGGDDFERKLLREMAASDQTSLRAAAARKDSFASTFLPAWQTLLDFDPDAIGTVVWDQKLKVERDGWLEMSGLLRNTTYQEELPTVFLYPKEWTGKTVVWLTGRGKEGLFESDGSPIPEVRRLLKSGSTVLGVDLIYQGEFNETGEAPQQAGVVKNPRQVPAYTFGYNNSVFTWRVQDVASVVAYVRNHERKTTHLTLVANSGAGPIAAAARAVLGIRVDSTAIDTGGFRFINLRDYRDLNFLPGAAKYGDLPGLIALGGPGEVRIQGESTEFIKILVRDYPHALGRIVAAGTSLLD